MSRSSLPDDFYLPPGVSREFRKADPPKTGPAFGHWAGRDIQYLQMPGGAMLQFDLSRLTLQDYRVMRDHYQVNASLTVLQFMMHRMDWHIECSDPKIASGIEENIRQVWTRLIRAISQAYWAGYSPIAIDWKNDDQAFDGKGGIVVDKFKDLIPEECKVNWKKVEGYAPPGHIPPKYFVFDGIKQWGLQWPIPTDNSLWYPLLMENGNYLGKKLLRPAFQPWYFSILVHLFSNRYFERFGEPVPIGRADYDDDIEVNGERINGRDWMNSVLQDLRNRSVVTLPSERQQVGASGANEYIYDIEYLESQMRGADFETYLTRLDTEITLGLFTPLLLLRGDQGGNYNLGVQQMQMYLWMLNALAGDMKEYIDNYVISRLKDFNFGPNAPRATWEFRDMGKESVETVRAMLVELIKDGQVKPDITELGVAAGIKLEDIAALTRKQEIEDQQANKPQDGGGDGTDTRPTRVRDDRKKGSTSRPKGVGEPRATQRDIAARIQGTVDNLFRKGEGAPLPKANLGYKKALIEDFITEGATYGAATAAVEQMYAFMNVWLEDAISLCGSSYADADAFMADFDGMFDRRLSDAHDRAIPRG